MIGKRPNNEAIGRTGEKNKGNGWGCGLCQRAGPERGGGEGRSARETKRDQCPRQEEA